MSTESICKDASHAVKCFDYQNRRLNFRSF